jgi:tRNA(fMet)-specific endonuclease VapC
VNDVGVCSIVRAELMFGALRSRDVQKNLNDVRAFLSPLPSLPFDDVAADACATIRTSLAQQGVPIGPNDTMIAAIALAHGLILVTHNMQDLSRIQGLQLEDWQATP